MAGALTLTAACAAAGLVWTTTQHATSRAAPGAAQLTTRSNVVVLARPPGALAMLTGAGGPGIPKTRISARARTPAAEQLSISSTPYTSSQPVSPAQPSTLRPLSPTRPARGDFEAIDAAGQDFTSADMARKESQQISMVRDSRESTRGGRSYGETATESALRGIDGGLRAATSVVVHENGLTTEFVTNEAALGEALRAAGVDVQPGDSVSPALETPIHPGLHVFVRHSTPISMEVGGTMAELRTVAGTVGEALDEHGITLGGDDRVEPALDTPIEPAMTISVVRVEREIVTEQELLDFQVERRPDPELAIGEQRIEPGQEGLREREIEIVRENGSEVSRSVTREWIEAEPQTGIEYYGTKLVVRDLDTPDGGELHYTRSMLVYTTWYNASHGEKPRSSPWYGITATGMRAGRGVVAVDPRVIPLYTRLYIPGYGLAVAGDTGGMVKGAHIDLGFEEEEISPWRTGWVTVYILD